MLPQVNLVRTDDADYLVMSPGDLISQSLWAKGKWAPFLRTVTAAFLGGQEAPIVLDIGANLGGYCIPLARSLQQQGGAVWAFEPQRMVYYQLCGNVFLNRLDNVTALLQAVGDEERFIDIPQPDYSRFRKMGGYSLESSIRAHQGTEPYMSGRLERVASIRLDDLDLPGRASFIKLDVEGMELKVLRGATRFLEEHDFPPIAFEAWDEPWFAADKAQLLDFVRALGYRYFHLGGDEYVAQHPMHRAQVQFERSGEKLALNRVR